MASGVTVKSSMDGKDYEKALENAIEASLQKAGAIVEDQAVALAPVDSGRLRASITWATRRKGDRVRPQAEAGDAVTVPSAKWVAYIGSNVEYAPYLEYGTVRSAAQPYLRPALQDKKRDIVRDFSEWVERHLKRGR